jgi:sRNA-binding protein
MNFKKRRNRYTVSPRIADFIDYMQECFPVAFPAKPNPKVALKVGIFEDLVAWAATIGVPKSMVKKAIRAWCQGLRYTQALAVVGAPRYDLQGNIVGEIDVDQARGAKGLLNKIMLLQEKGRREKITQLAQELSAA